jgi:hypothetical protein
VISKIVTDKDGHRRERIDNSGGQIKPVGELRIFLGMQSLGQETDNDAKQA